MIELEELDSITGKDLEKTGEQVFKTAAIPQISKLDQSRFKVTYFWDPVKKVVDLKQAYISFPKDMIKYPSCLDYIQVDFPMIELIIIHLSSGHWLSGSFSNRAIPVQAEFKLTKSRKGS